MDQKNNTKFVFLLFFSTVIICFFYISFSSINSSFPYYYFWDMDRFVTLDVLLMQQGKIPTTLHHTGFGTYFLLVWTQKFAHWMGAISILNYTDIQYSLNPLLGTAEVTDFFRAHEPFLCTLLILSLWVSVILLFSLSFWQSILLLIFFGTQRSLYLQSSLIRTELYSVLYWSLAILCISAALKWKEHFAKASLIMLSGIFLGLSYLTKVQSLGLIAVVPVFYLFFQALKDSPNYDFKNSGKLFQAISLANFLFFFLLLVGAFFRHPIGATYVTSYPLNRIGMAAFIFPFILFLIESNWLNDFPRINRLLSVWPNFRFIHLIVSGFGLSFFLHFVTPVTFKNAFKYFFLDAKMLFFRKPFEDTLVVTSALYEIMRKVTYNQWMLLLNASLLLLFMFLVKSKRARIYALILNILAYAYMTYGSRPIVRDQFWSEIVFSFVAAIFLAVLWSLSNKRWLKYSTYLALILFISFNIYSARFTKNSMRTLFAHYCCQLDKSFQSMNPDAGEAKGSFAEIMKEKFPTTTLQKLSSVLMEQSLNHDRVQQTIQSVFPNSDLNLRNAGLLVEEMPVWSDQPDVLLKKIPNELRNSIVVDGTNAKPNGFWIDRKMNTYHSEEMEAVSTTKKMDKLGVMTRDADLKVYAVTNRYNGLAKPYEYWNLTDFKIELGDNTGTKSYSVYEIQNYDEYDSSQMKDVFWVISQKYSI